ncbi:MAG: glycosyltransferase [Terracidiphilus sp.]|jgi:glycosyltransferase involved in cell wall biosynthesis
MKVAIVHPWFLEGGGGEKVVDILVDMYPNADIFALSVDPAVLSARLRGRKICTSNLNSFLSFRLRLLRPIYLIPFLPFAVESIDVSKYDLVLSSCGPAVMGVNVNQDAVHISYVYSPQRAWWDLYAERRAQIPWILRGLYILGASFIRTWEFSAMQRVDHVISISNYIAHRVFKYFRRSSTVIYPPVDTSMGYIANQHDDYYLSVSRLDAGKRVDLLIHACNQLKRRLLIVGIGREEKRLKAIAGPTIKFLGRVPDADLPGIYANCRAFLFSSDEDFGIAPVEAQAFGRPVIAYGRGGSLETVRVGDAEGRSDTGVFFSEQTAESIIDGMRNFEAREDKFVPEEIQQHARQFDTSVFVQQFSKFVDSAMERK